MIIKRKEVDVRISINQLGFPGLKKVNPDLTIRRCLHPGVKRLNNFIKIFIYLLLVCTFGCRRHDYLDTIPIEVSSGNNIISTPTPSFIATSNDEVLNSQFGQAAKSA